MPDSDTLEEGQFLDGEKEVWGKARAEVMKWLPEKQKDDPIPADSHGAAQQVGGAYQPHMTTSEQKH